MAIDLKQLMLIWQFLNILAPMIAQLYDAVRLMFPDGTPGAVKLDAFKALVQQVVATRDELKQYEPLFNDAWPLVQTMVTKFHDFMKSIQPAPTAPPAA